MEAEASEPRNANQVSLFTSHGGTKDGDRFTLARTVTELVEDLRDNDRLGGPGIHHQPERSRRPVRPPDTATDNDEISRAIERVTFTG